MSYDLFVWHRPTADDPDDAADLVDAVAEGEMDRLEPSPAVEAFLSDLFAEHPPLGKASPADTPWACSDDTSDRHALLSIQAGAAPTVAERIVELASKHGLHCFDPQSGDVYC